MKPNWSKIREFAKLNSGSYFVSLHLKKILWYIVKLKVLLVDLVVYSVYYLLCGRMLSFLGPPHMKYNSSKFSLIWMGL